MEGGIFTNRSQRKTIEEIAGVLEGIRGDFEQIANEERQKLAALSLNDQAGARGAKFERSANMVDGWADSIGSVIDGIEAMIEGVQA